MQEELSEIKKKNELLKLELEEKEKTCVKLHREIDLLQQNLYKERTRLEVKQKNI